MEDRWHPGNRIIERGFIGETVYQHVGQENHRAGTASQGAVTVPLLPTPRSTGMRVRAFWVPGLPAPSEHAGLGWRQWPWAGRQVRDIFGTC